MEPVSIARGVGKDAPNDEADVRKIQGLLNRVRIGPDLQVNGKCDAGTLSAIGNFQRIWFGEDYRIDPNGTTLRRLNGTAKPLTLKSISLTYIRNGGYAIAYSGFVPPASYKVLLYPEGRGQRSYYELPDDALDITKPGLNNAKATVRLKVETTLPGLLKLIEQENAWGGWLPFKAHLVNAANGVVTSSNDMILQCPIKPYAGPIQLAMAQNGPPMYYTGKTTGRYFWPSPFGGKRFFSYGGKFETEMAKRGFDCTTYVGTVLGLNPLAGQMAGDGLDLANLAGAEIVRYEYAPGQTKEMESINSKTLKEFFSKNAEGAYIVWSAGHVMLVRDAVVHEFSIPDGLPGYYQRKVADRPWQSGTTYSVRKLPISLA
ncbi:MAG: hypothetical protein HZA04_09270 [Nitrospinae bacterium]|nr:hypothetical protein [Nitrospinota bacterium]